MLLRRALAFLGFALLLTAAGRKRSAHKGQHRHDEQAGAPQDRAPPAGDEQPIRPLPPALDSAERAEEREHRSAERRYWKWSIVLGTASAIAALGAAYFARSALNASWQAVEATRDQARIAQDTLVANNRPWLMLTEVKPVSLTSDDEDGVGFWATFVVKNVGHSVAQNVMISARLLIDQFDPFPDQVMGDVCAEARNSPNVIPGQVVFPDQQQNIFEDAPESFFIEASRVWAARSARINSAYISMGFGRSAERAKAEAEELARFPFYGALYLAGCINYRFDGNKVLHQTSFVFDITSKDVSFPLLGGVAPKIHYPEEDPNDPGTLHVFPRFLQRRITGEHVKLGVPLFGQIAN